MGGEIYTQNVPGALGGANIVCQSPLCGWTKVWREGIEQQEEVGMVCLVSTDYLCWDGGDRTIGGGRNNMSS